jgi:hypothetical protein
MMNRDRNAQVEPISPDALQPIPEASRISGKRRFRTISPGMVAWILACVFAVTPAHAQLATQHIKGLVGLKAGTQPPPNVYFIAPVLYRYSTDTVKNREGQRVPIDVNLTSSAFGGGVNVVTNKKILGGNYGFQALFPLGANNRIQATEIDANPGAGLTDSGFVPISLGWHFKRADAIASYSIFAPTGRYTDGANDNTGFGMWGQEVAFGTTFYLNESKQYHASTIASVTFQTEKEDSDTKVGTAMNLEGGFGADFLKGGLTAGLNYYSSFKLTQDRLAGFPVNVGPAKSRVFALGPEAQLALARKGTLYGFVKVNYQWEVYARTTTQGGELSILATFLLKPLKLP